MTDEQRIDALEDDIGRLEERVKLLEELVVALVGHPNAPASSLTPSPYPPPAPPPYTYPSDGTMPWRTYRLDGVTR